MSKYYDTYQKTIRKKTIIYCFGVVHLFTLLPFFCFEKHYVNFIEVLFFFYILKKDGEKRHNFSSSIELHILLDNGNKRKSIKIDLLIKALE